MFMPSSPPLPAVLGIEGVPALRGVNLTVRRGEMVLILVRLLQLVDIVIVLVGAGVGWLQSVIFGSVDAYNRLAYAVTRASCTSDLLGQGKSGGGKTTLLNMLGTYVDT